MAFQSMKAKGMSNGMIKKFKVGGKQTEVAVETQTEQNFDSYHWFSPTVAAGLLVPPMCAGHHLLLCLQWPLPIEGAPEAAWTWLTLQKGQIFMSEAGQVVKRVGILQLGALPFS